MSGPHCSNRPAQAIASIERRCLLLTFLLPSDPHPAADSQADELVARQHAAAEPGGGGERRALPAAAAAATAAGGMPNCVQLAV